MTASCLYEGTIRHRRRAPAREFTHGIALAYIDLDELPALLGGRLLARRPGVVRFRRADYLGDARVPLDRAVRDTVQAATGRRPGGPVRLLTHLRTFGHCFNPVSFYYCFAGERIEALVAEVTNTPWGERRAYVLTPGQADGSVFCASFDKSLHVSPFMGMAQRYTCHAGAPARTLALHVESRERDATVFDATLALGRVELTPRALRRMTARYPLGTLRVLGLIYTHALALKLAGAPVFPHPHGGKA